jgi:hypothetical protein
MDTQHKKSWIHSLLYFNFTLTCVKWKQCLTLYTHAMNDKKLLALSKYKHKL